MILVHGFLRVHCDACGKGLPGSVLLPRRSPGCGLSSSSFPPESDREIGVRREPTGIRQQFGATSIRGSESCLPANSDWTGWGRALQAGDRRTRIDHRRRRPDAALGQKCGLLGGQRD